MNLMPIRLTMHAQDMIEDRKIPVAWVEATITVPDYTQPDPLDAALTRAFRAIPEASGRILRVVYRQDGDETVIVTTHFDRGASR
jgi:hypothetical protein